MVELEISAYNQSPKVDLEEYPIVRIEKEYYGDRDDLKHDIRELAYNAGFKVTRITVTRLPDNGHNEIMEAYTNTYQKIPKSMKRLVKDWLMKVSWSHYVVDVSVKMEENSVVDHTNEKIDKKSKGSVVLKT